MTRKLIVTVDTELSNFPEGMGLWGRVDGEDWGLGRMIRAFDAIGVRGTFFLDAYGGGEADIAQQRRAAELIVGSGHDLQLHTHPAPAFDRARDQLKHYSLAEQMDIIGLGCQRLEAWSGTRPVLHRAGDWAADHRSLRALGHHGFRADFSASPWSANCGIDRELIAGNGWTRIERLLCGVGTCYRDRLTGRLRRVDLGGVSFREALEVLAHGVDPFFLTLHSFSFLRYNTARTRFASDPGYAAKLARFCEVARAQGYEIATALDAVNDLEHHSALPWRPLPTTGALASTAGLLKSLRGRVSALRH